MPASSAQVSAAQAPVGAVICVRSCGRLLEVRETAGSQSSTAPSRCLTARVLAERLTAQLLAGEPARSVGAVVGRLLAVQAQDLRAAHLGVRARSAGLTSADVDAALASRELVVTWVNRGTLHLVRSEDYPWLHALTTPQLATGNATRLRQEGVSPAQAEQAVAAIERALRDGPQTRAQLREVLQRKGIPVAGQALVHELVLATLRGICVRGPMVGKEQAFVDVREWLPRSKAVDRDTALRQLGHRYAAGHGPSTERDLAKWAGITLSEARKAMTTTTREAAPLPGPRLLGGYDELLMGWESRDLVLDGHRGVVTMNGIFKPIAIVRGRAVATWALPRGRVALQPFAALSAAVTRALDVEGQDVQRFLGVGE